MLKLWHARLQHYVNQELPDFQAGFRKRRRTRDQITNIRWIIEKVREHQENNYLCFSDYSKAFDCVHYKQTVESNSRDENTRLFYLSPEKPVYKSRSNS